MRHFSLLLLLAACAPRVPGPGPALHGHVTNAYTLRWIDAVRGTGAVAMPKKRVKVHYTGWLADGKKFDSSYDRSTPFEFQLGAGKVIVGWDTGITGMRVGGKRRLLIPYQLAYGEAGRPQIPPRADLTFDVELLEVEGSDAPKAK